MKLNPRTSCFPVGGQAVNRAVLEVCLVQMFPNVLLSLQVIEDNTGVRRVVVTPQSPECFPPSYPSAISPTHHLPPYLTHHPHFIHNSHTAFYPPVTGPGDMPPQFFPQHHLPPTIYGEQGELGGRDWDWPFTAVFTKVSAGGTKSRKGELEWLCYMGGASSNILSWGL